VADAGLVAKNRTYLRPIWREFPVEGQAVTNPTLREEEIFDAARQIEESGARQEYIEQACGDDHALRGRIDALLRIHDGDHNFLESPAKGIGDAWNVPLGTVIGAYTLFEPIGDGGMGVVYRAEQAEPIRREVALKIIKPGMDSRQVMARFEAERQALALMDHPNIAKILDAGQSLSTTWGGLSRPYFVMELVRGVPVTKYCDEQHLTPRQRLELFIPVCQAVQHAHQKGIIHRDMKPSNVLVAHYDGRPVPKIIDFGVAKAIGQRLVDRTFDTNFGAIIGTLEYMSPEQAVPSQADIDTRSDIYSLGVLLYELLTGTTPFPKKELKAGALLEALRMIREDEPQKPSTRLSTVDELPSIAANRGVEPRKLAGTLRGDLDWIVMKSLEKDRARRYETANGLARDIQRFLSEEAVEARPPSAGYRFHKFVRRNKAAFSAAAACALMLLVATAVSAWQAWRATLAERESRRNEVTAMAALRRADEEAAITKAVNQFLQNDLLGQADVGNQPRGIDRDKNITVRAVLDRAADGIRQRFSDQEVTEAAIRLTLGRAYAALGEYPLALEHLQQSVTLRTRLLGEDHADTLESMSALGELERLRGRFDEAEGLLKRVLKSCETRFGDQHPDTLRAMNQLGLLYAVSNKYSRGDELLHQSLAGRQAVLGPKHLDTLESLETVALHYRLSREPEKATGFSREALEGFRETLGADHPKTLQALLNLGNDYFRLGQYADAEPLLRQALEGYRAKRGADHPATLASMFDLARLCDEAKRFDEAESFYRQAFTGMRIRLGRDHPLTLNAEGYLSHFYNHRGRWDDAEPLLKELLEISRAAPGRDGYETIRLLNNLGFHYLARGRLDDAEPLLRQTVAECEQRLAPSDGLANRAKVNLAILNLKRGRPELAEAPIRQVVEYNRDYGMTGNGLSEELLAWLALCLLRQEKHVEAEAIARQSLELRAKYRKRSWDLPDSQILLGRVLAAQKKYADAEPLLVAGAASLKETLPDAPWYAHERLTDGRSCLIQLYEAIGKPAEADKWRKELSPTKP
jgi:serine/threonine protein kinase